MTEETRKYKVKIVGVAPLLQNRFDTEASLKKGRKRQNPTPEEDCQKALYKREDDSIYILQSNQQTHLKHIYIFPFKKKICNGFTPFFGGDNRYLHKCCETSSTTAYTGT